MDEVLCDELLEEILRWVPSAADGNSVSLVSKRWLSAYRLSRTALSLRLPPAACSLSFSSLVTHYPNLTSLTLTSDSPGSGHLLPDRTLISLASLCTNLTQLRFLVGPVTSSSLIHLASSCKSLNSLKINAFRLLDFRWLAGCRSLRTLSVNFLDCSEYGLSSIPEFDFSSNTELRLENIFFTGIRNGDVGVDWLWRNCSTIRKLQLCSCEGIGSSVSNPSLLRVLSGIRELELIACRSITGNLLLRVAEHCRSLVSLVLYDGGNREGLIQVIRNCGSLRKIDLRLPLDLDNEGLMAIADNCHDLRSLCLQSCVMITGASLRRLGQVLGSNLEELVLVNCDVVEREPGLLTSLGQSLRRLRRLDLSYNEFLFDKEMGSMLASCGNLVELRLRGCKGLTDLTICSIMKNCRLLEIVDINQCHRITSEGVRMLLQIPQSSQILVEESKIPQ